MDQAVEAPTSTAGEPTPAPAVVEGASPAGDAPTAAVRRRRLPEWWHRDHPVFVPLAGFFTGLTFILLVPGTYGALLKSVAGYERAEELFPFVVLTLVVPIALVVPPRTRRFGWYMIFGALSTAAVVVGVALAVLWFLLNRDG